MSKAWIILANICGLLDPVRATICEKIGLVDPGSATIICELWIE